MNNDIHISKSFLSSGQDFKLNNSLTVKHPTIQEVFDIDKDCNGRFSEDIYYSWVSIFICDPYDYMVYLDDKKIDYEKIEPLDLFILLYKDMCKKYETQIKPYKTKEEYEQIFISNPYFSAFKFFLNKNHFILALDENENIVIGDFDTQTVMIDKEIFSYISEFIKKINGIYNRDRINPEDEFAKQMLIDDERSRISKLLKKSPEENDNKDRLGNLLSALTWGGNGGITPFNRNKLHMYDLVDGIERTDKLLNFKHTMVGLYTGNIDKDKINMQKIGWTSS